MKHQALRLGLGSILTIALLLTANLPVSARSADAALPTLRWLGLTGTSTWVQTLDPPEVSDTVSGGVVQMVYASMVKLTPTGQPEPDLTTWRVSKNHRVYWFTVRKGARFSNGDPVTAQDIAYSLTRALAKGTDSPVALLYIGHILGAKRWNAGKASRLQGVKVLNAHTVQITLDKPIPYFVKTLTIVASVLDRRIVIGKRPQTYLTNTCDANIGAGPFMFVCRSHGSDRTSFYGAGHTATITLVPNPYYYGPKPHIRVVMSVIADTQTNYRLFQANQIDTTVIPSADVARDRGKPGFVQYLSADVEYLAPNFDAPPFNNIHCRLAVAYAIDQQTLNNDVLHRTQLPLYSIVPRGIPAHYAATDAPHYNPARARAELRQCPGGIHNIKLVYYKGSSDLDDEFAAIQNMLSQVGIGVTLQGMTLNDWLTVVDQPLYKTHNTISYDDWNANFPDPQQFLFILLRGGSVQNISDYNNATYNQLIDRADVTFNPAKRTALYIRAQRLALSQGAFIPFGQPVGHDMVKPWVHGLIGTPFVGADGLAPRGNNWANVSVSRH